MDEKNLHDHSVSCGQSKHNRNHSHLPSRMQQCLHCNGSLDLLQCLLGVDVQVEVHGQ